MLLNSIIPLYFYTGSSKNVSQTYSSGLGYSVTTYRDKMLQMNDQERIIEEKKRQIEAKLAAEQIQKSKEAAAAQASTKVTPAAPKP